MTALNNNSLTQMLERLNKVEQQCGKLAKQNRILKHIVMIVALLILAVPVMGQALPNNEIIEAKGVTLRDQSGKARIKLMIKNNEPLLRFIDDNKKDRLIMTINNGEPSIVLCDKIGTNKVSLFLFNDSPKLVLLNKDNNPVFIAPHE